MNEQQITILLATYNGEKYLHAQLVSLLHQTYTNWRLLVRDDHSTDGTPQILEQYRQQYPDKVIIVKNEEGNKGSRANFDALLSLARNAPYVMFCDQDDSWLPDKIAVTFAKMQALEKIEGTGCPIMVFTNFVYADENLQPIASKKRFRVNRLKKLAFAQLMVQNPVYGCTAMLNGALLQKVHAIPPQAENHDYWAALVAAALGRLHYLPQKTILYRQHAGNVSGNHDNSSLKKRLQRVLVNKKNFTILANKQTMLLQFKAMYYAQLSPALQGQLDAFLQLYRRASLPVLYTNIRNGIRAQTGMQTLLLYASFLGYKNKETCS